MNRTALISAFAELDRRNQWLQLFNKLGIEANKQEQELALTVEESYLDINFCKNRYQNVLPYDQNRVLLNNVIEGQTTFLNASPLSVPFANKNYILTQGPLETTAEDFWQMVWEQKAFIVVMLNNIFEKGSLKCHHYFVDEDEKEKRFGNFRITLEEEYGTNIYRVRKIKLTAMDDKFLDNGENTFRMITHYHYTNWPDFGVPNETGSFLEFLAKTSEAQNLLKSKDEMDSPVIVHCSAGIGRSGAYVVVDCVLNYLQRSEQLLGNDAAGGDVVQAPKSIDDLVVYIRRHRMGLIQTPEQLRFCWQAIVDWLKAHPDANEKPSQQPKPISPNRKRSSQPDPSIESRMQKIQEMREKLRRVEESKNRWWCRMWEDEKAKYWVGSTIAVLGAVAAFYVYNIHSTTK